MTTIIVTQQIQGPPGGGGAGPFPALRMNANSPSKQITTTSNFSTAQLPPGQYRWLTSGFTAIYATVQRIPQA